MSSFNTQLIVLRVQMAAFVFLLFPLGGLAKAVVFWQEGFPTIESEVVNRAALQQALAGLEPTFAGIAGLNEPATLAGADLLVLPYGSAVPVEAWKTMLAYLQAGGNILIIGGRPLRVPVVFVDGKYQPQRAQESYSRALGMRHSYEVPGPGDASFQWKQGYGSGELLRIKAKQFFAVEGRLNGLGYVRDSTGLQVAAPVIFADRGSSNALVRGRMVAVDFNPMPGYWESSDGISLIRGAAEYAGQGGTLFSIESLYSLLRPGETPQLSIHLEHARTTEVAEGEVALNLISGGAIIDSASLHIPASAIVNLPIPIHKPLGPGFYEVTASYSQHFKVREYYRNGFWVSAPEALTAGPVLGVHGDFLTRDKKPFFPVGTNYFTTEENGWDFSGPRNAAVWEKDFGEMETHGVNFVRTGVWMQNLRFIDGDLGRANERFLRNLEAYLLSAQRHHIAVNFTFFAFSPRPGNARGSNDEDSQPNPYLDPDAIHAEQAYIRSVVERFKSVPWLSWDLINEPSFSNPRHVFAGNYPNGDLVESAAWHTWLRKRYGSPGALADAWSVTPEQLGGFETIPLPAIGDLTYRRYGDPNQVRAFDYHLFSQEMFSGWVKLMVETIRDTGSRQLIDVGQDEGGVTDRVLNQFYGRAGVSFTTNHTYWEDDALLWDSVVAKVPGIPNITGETGYQPAWASDGTWRYDEFTGLGLTERKWALGFAAGTSGAMQWDWAREPDFGMLRSDGSAKVWENMMRDMGQFAQAASPYATGFVAPQIAIVLPHSLQMSVMNHAAREAEQNAVRALYQYARGEAYAVSEYQIDLLGSPKLILLPSPMGLSSDAWKAIEGQVRGGAVLLVTGPFDGDEHMHPTGREKEIGLPFVTELLEIREQHLHWPGGDELFSFGGDKTTILNQARFADGTQWKELSLGKGQILFSALPLELSENLEGLGRIYAYAMRKAKVTLPYTTSITDPGILICPTSFPEATLYVLTSESNQRTVAFHDNRSGRDFSETLDPGRASMVLIGRDGRLLASYHWKQEGN